MDKNAIKKYAVWARTELIDRVTQKALQYGITEKDSVPASATSVNGVVLSKDEMQQRKALLERIAKKGYKHVIEEVAYTWFNRFSALRFMEVNGYLPSRVRVFTDEHNRFNPQILTEAISLEMAGLDMEKVYAYKDANDNEGLFKYLIIVQCNALNPIMPGMFQRIADYTELLFPDNLLREGSAVQRMIEWIPEEDWKDAVEIIGWLYQDYNTDLKAEVFDRPSNSKLQKEEIPAATQLFTPDWIVRYLVQNSLGRLWLDGHTEPGLKEKWVYHLDEAKQEDVTQQLLAEKRRESAALNPEDILCIDPCMGSGHILVYMFDVLMDIYASYGFGTREAVASIVEHNLWGLDIDDRASQLAYFAVMMKARQYDRRFFSRGIQPNVMAIVESNHLSSDVISYFVNGCSSLESELRKVIQMMRDAKEYGSLVNVLDVDFELLYSRLDEIENDISIFSYSAKKEIAPLIRCANILSQKYHVVVTNPPYVGSPSMGAKLLDFVKKEYPAGKADLFSCFILKCTSLAHSCGYTAMITQSAWMFQSRFEDLRITMQSIPLICMAHLGTRAFDSISGEVVQTTAFCYSKIAPANKYNTHFVRLTEPKGEAAKESAFFNPRNHCEKPVSRFSSIPGVPFAYYISDNAINSFDRGEALKGKLQPKQGTSTGNDEIYVRSWYEIDYSQFGLGFEDTETAHASGYRYFPLDKGGEYRKWYGNNEKVIKFDPISYSQLLDMGNHLPSRNFYFAEGLTWSKIASELSVRFDPTGYVFSSVGLKGFPTVKHRDYILGYMNSIVCKYFVKVISPGMSIVSGDIEKLPLIISENTAINDLVQENIRICKTDWDAFEISWDFGIHPLVPSPKEWAEQRNSQFADTRTAKFSQLSWHYDQWERECRYRFDSMRENEEELNRIFIDIYGLQDELTPNVEDKDVSVRLADKKRDIKSLISYAVGCMFGRYSLDVPGLAYAGGEWDDSKYVTFKADKDSIIPICDDEYFADDIVGRFIRFIEVVYGKDTLQENLRFIADALGGSGQPKDVIRKYFMDEFYADHLKIYQKRPIYWLFDSGKKGGFKALVYMHRYQPDTIARMRTDYVHEQQARYRTAIADLEQRIASASTSERVKLSKRLKTLQEQATEIQGYEEKIHHLADQYIAIDLDDGVKTNYARFQEVLARLK